MNLASALHEDWQQDMDDAMLKHGLAESYIKARICCTFTVATVWIVCCCGLLLSCGLVYQFLTTDQARQHYMVSASNRVAIQATPALSCAIACRDVLDYAIQRKFYFDPLDTVTILQTLSPVMSAYPSIRAVDLVFTTMPYSVTVSRLYGYGSGLRLLVQSDEPTCLPNLGPFGCSRAPNRADSTSWYQLGLVLPGGQEADNVTLPQAAAVYESSYIWFASPGFVQAGANNTGEGATMPSSDPNNRPGMVGWTAGGSYAAAWDAAYSLVFRSTFPGTMGSLSLVGRATIDVNLISSASLLQDMMLGTGGVYICDNLGAIIASLQQGEQVTVSNTEGDVRFRYAWELARPWASGLTQSMFSNGQVNQIASSGFRVMVTPLTSRGLGHFRVLMASDAVVYSDSMLLLCCWVAQIIVGLPLAIVFLTYVTFKCCRKWEKRRELRRISDEALAAMRHEASRRKKNLRGLGSLSDGRDARMNSMNSTAMSSALRVGQGHK